MKSNWKKAGAAVFAASLVVAACGGDDDDTTSATTAAPAGTDAPSGTDAPAGDSLLDGEIPCEQQYAGKTVVIFSPVRNSDTDPTTVADFVAGYDPLVECTGVKIDFQGTDQFETEINVRMEGGNPPDVVDYPQPGLMRSHIEKGYLVQPPADVTAHIADFAEGWDVYASGADGTIYGLPGRSSVKSMVWYSPSKFAAGGYEIPETLEDLTTLSDKMVADGTTPWCIGAESGVATGWVITDWIEDFMMRINGGEVYDQWVNHEIPFNDPQVKAAVDAVGAFVKNPDYLGGDNNVKAIATTKFQDGGLAIVSGDCQMHRQASFYVGSWPEGTNVAPDGDVWFFYLPSPAGGPRYMLGAGDIYAAATDKPESFDVVRYTGSAAYQTAIANTRNELGPNKDIDLDAIEDPFLKAVFELQGTGDVFRFDGSDLMPGAVGSGSFWTEITAWVIGGDTDTMLNNIEATWPTS